MMTKKVKVHYQGGQSRYGNHAVDYMLAVIDDVELYAEMPPVDGDETATYSDLKAEIIEQAQDAGIDVDMLEFWYDGILYNSNQLAMFLGVTRQAIHKRIGSGSIKGDYYTVDGHPLFTHDVAERLRHVIKGEKRHQ